MPGNNGLKQQTNTEFYGVVSLVLISTESKQPKC